jgi:membrane-bound serine protease (ClpP class)
MKIKSLRLIRFGLAVLIVLATVTFLAIPCMATAKKVHVIRVSGAISPGSADFIKHQIEDASIQGAACIVIELDTPGGLASSMRTIVMVIYASNVPVVVYVSPSGARAASAGVMVTMAADIAAMAPGTNIGAAHPVAAGGKKINETMNKKVVNDMVAYSRSIAKKRGRNEEWIEKAVRESVSVTATDALKAGIIDVLAKDLDELLKKIDGRAVAGKGTLNLDKAEIKRIPEDLRTKILKTISDPNIAYILMMVGLAGLYFELSHPGAIFPGAIGALCLILAFFASQTLAFNYAGVLLIALALIFFVLEMKIISYGLLSIAGTVALFLGSLMLFKKMPGVALSLKVVWPTVMVVAGFFIAVAGLVFKAQMRRPKTGADGILGEVGVVKQKLAPQGRVLVHGELWKAVCPTTVTKGKKVRVTAVEGLTLSVEPIET